MVFARQNNFPNSLLVITECSVKTLNFLFGHDPELTGKSVTFKKSEEKQREKDDKERREAERER